MIKLEALCSRPCLSHRENFFPLNGYIYICSLKQFMEGKNNSGRQKDFGIICMSVSNKLARIINFQDFILILRTIYSYMYIYIHDLGRSCLISTYFRRLPDRVVYNVLLWRKEKVFHLLFSPYQQIQRVFFLFCRQKLSILFSFSHLHQKRDWCF